ncbi:uncharacterized protein LOC112142076 isoform X2 [Oryzias melastigma]|uniref:uncharacterized protein LOC112142076 isoform X2 n=1 Tax=Oryzias melastigma TaxID=30732 RepID=UPI000CF7BF67|nr:uncharacterized protein LOC112142076 isoform X2 [Oryzias melastigma]
MDESDEPPRGDIPDRRAGATGRAITKKKKKLQTISQHMRRRKHLQKLKKHHRKCEKRYNKAQMKLANRERERTLRLQSCTNSEEKHSSSENTIILDQTPTELSQDSSVPELKRTDSVYVTREMIGLSESSSCSGSGEEYIPQAESEESTDDETAVPPTRQPQKKMRKETKRREEIALEPSDSDDEADKTLQEVSPQGPVRARRATDLQERTAVEKDKEIQLPVETPVTSSLRDGPSRKRKWSEEEVEAVEKTLMEFITMRKVPGKTPCQLCIQTSPAALENRTWEGIKYYVKNRIDALKRKEK